jgi:hypothetical protein
MYVGTAKHRCENITGLIFYRVCDLPKLLIIIMSAVETDTTLVSVLRTNDALTQVVKLLIITLRAIIIIPFILL